MKWIDLHCDTLSILAEKGRPEKKGRKADCGKMICVLIYGDCMRAAQRHSFSHAM